MKTQKKCDLCEEKPAKYIMVNKHNGNKLIVCEVCYIEVWGSEL